MESKEIRELAAIMKEMGLSVLDYREKDTSIRLERGATLVTAHAGVPAETAVSEELSAGQAIPGGHIVRSPMVGIFYSAPGADKEPYVSEGDKVQAGDVLCIIEAMKIMNEITAECDGVITEIYAGNKQIVEFNQPLFGINRDQ